MHKKIHLFIIFLFLLPLSGLYGQSLPSFSSTLFSGSANCQFCHTSGSGILTSRDGRDVSPPTSWRSSMMANSSKDPYWRAKVSTETSEFPQLASAIEDKCTTCHAPMGRTETLSVYSQPYSLSILAADALGKGGVSCTVCHQIRKDNLGTSDGYSGAYIITGAREIFGPYTAPLVTPMVNRVNYTPVYSDHVGILFII